MLKKDLFALDLIYKMLPRKSRDFFFFIKIFDKFTIRVAVIFLNVYLRVIKGDCGFGVLVAIGNARNCNY